ncbi:MAG: hypothetical protein E6K58_01900 [Nitrospirae bacterium]|nr:MAG: hypothetical protein E6K58_01900 [Nitrospirota bacterium]
MRPERRPDRTPAAHHETGSGCGAGHSGRGVDGSGERLTDARPPASGGDGAAPAVTGTCSRGSRCGREGCGNALPAGCAHRAGPAGDD